MENIQRPDYIEALLGDPPAPPPAREAAPSPPGAGEVHREFPLAQLDADAVKVVQRLKEADHEAFLVGGCVRDLLFGLRPKDFDIVTSAQPAQIRRLFRNCRVIGRRFRLVHVFFRDKTLEVATFRAAAEQDPESGDLLIRDDNVFGSAEEDARRRDFTINALFYDVERQVIVDHVGGVDDARRRIVRTIGDPEIRLREDPIRILRAIRLASRLGCSIDDATLDGIRRHGDGVLQAAAPRIHEDLLRMFSGGAMAPAFDHMLRLGLLEVLVPELHDHLRRAVESGREEEVEATRRVLRVADAWTQAGRQLGPSVRLALLLAPVLLSGLDDATKRDAGTEVNSLLRPIAQRLAISKRECERIRQVLLAAGRFVPHRKRRRFSVNAFVKRAYFPDALDFFELMTEATGSLTEEARRWRQRFREIYPDGPPEPPRRPARRRRRGREHGEKGARTG